MFQKRLCLQLKYFQICLIFNVIKATPSTFFPIPMPGSTKRAKTDSLAVDFALAGSVKAYDVVSVSKRSLRLYGEGDAVVEIGYTNPKSDILCARYDGKVYLGYNYWNPGFYNEKGECVEERAVGVTLKNLLSIFAIPGYRVFIPLHPRESWKAFFKPSSPVENTVLRLQVCLSSPFDAGEPGFYGIELELFEFLE